MKRDAPHPVSVAVATVRADTIPAFQYEGQAETSLDPGFAIPAGKSLYAEMLSVTASGIVTTAVQVFGYSVPAAQCTAPNVCA
jgi:hypothetical protein